RREVAVPTRARMARASGSWTFRAESVKTRGPGPRVDRFSKLGSVAAATEVAATPDSGRWLRLQSRRYPSRVKNRSTLGLARRSEGRVMRRSKLGHGLFVS